MFTRGKASSPNIEVPWEDSVNELQVIFAVVGVACIQVRTIREIARPGPEQLELAAFDKLVTIELKHTRGNLLICTN